MLPQGATVQSVTCKSSAWVVVVGMYPGVGPLSTSEPVGSTKKVAGPVSVAVTTTPSGVVPVATLPDKVQVAGYCETTGAGRACRTGLAEATGLSATALSAEPASAVAITAARTRRPLFTPAVRLRRRMAGKGQPADRLCRRCIMVSPIKKDDPKCPAKTPVLQINLSASGTGNTRTLSENHRSRQEARRSTTCFAEQSGKLTLFALPALRTTIKSILEMGQVPM